MTNDEQKKSPQPQIIKLIRIHIQQTVRNTTQHKHSTARYTTQIDVNTQHNILATNYKYTTHTQRTTHTEHTTHIKRMHRYTDKNRGYAADTQDARVNGCAQAK